MLWGMFDSGYNEEPPKSHRQLLMPLYYLDHEDDTPTFKKELLESEVGGTDALGARFGLGNTLESVSLHI